MSQSHLQLLPTNCFKLRKRFTFTSTFFRRVKYLCAEKILLYSVSECRSQCPIMWSSTERCFGLFYQNTRDVWCHTPMWVMKFWQNSTSFFESDIATLAQMSLPFSRLVIVVPLLESDVMACFLGSIWQLIWSVLYVKLVSPI